MIIQTMSYKRGSTLQVSFRMDAEVKSRIDCLARQTGWSNSRVMMLLIEGSLEIIDLGGMAPSLSRILRQAKPDNDIKVPRNQ